MRRLQQNLHPTQLTGQAEDAARLPGQNVTSRSRGSRSSVIITSQPYIARARGQARPGCCRAAASNTHRIMALWRSSWRERKKMLWENGRKGRGRGKGQGGGSALRCVCIRLLRAVKEGIFV